MRRELREAANGDGPLVLERFLPYRLSVLSNRISRGLAALYSDQFDLTVPEWRVMAMLGRFPGLSANDVCELTQMDKVRVSRAVARLLASGRIERQRDPSDRRRSNLSLSQDGRRIYRRIVPVARAYEAEILEELDGRQLGELDDLLNKLDAIAARMGGREAELGRGGGSRPRLRNEEAV